MYLPIPENTKEYSRRFWLSVNRVGKSQEECWLWNKKVGRKKKGNNPTARFNINKKLYYSIRVGYYLFHGIDPKDLCVCHFCNNSLCLNGNHMYLATHEQNTRDAARDGLYNPARGENNGLAKLTQEKVIEIRRLKSLGIETWYIAEKFNISETTTRKIINRKAWVHVE